MGRLGFAISLNSSLNFYSSLKEHRNKEKLKNSILIFQFSTFNLNENYRRTKHHIRQEINVFSSFIIIIDYMVKLHPPSMKIIGQLIINCVSVRHETFIRDEFISKYGNNVPHKLFMVFVLIGCRII